MDPDDPYNRYGPRDDDPNLLLGLNMRPDKKNKPKFGDDPDLMGRLGKGKPAKKGDDPNVMGSLNKGNRKKNCKN